MQYIIFLTLKSQYFSTFIHIALKSFNIIILNILNLAVYIKYIIINFGFTFIDNYNILIIIISIFFLVFI
jgi:hypothetical protein